jgi:hypothetical protein
MFGGLAFLLDGKLACGVRGERLMLRLGTAGADAALDEPSVAPMDFTGRPLRTTVYVETAGLGGRARLTGVSRSDGRETAHSCAASSPSSATGSRTPP